MTSWLGTWPANCDNCGKPLEQESVFFDAKTKYGPWGLFCQPCFSAICHGLGIGKGQCYETQNLQCIAGSGKSPEARELLQRIEEFRKACMLYGLESKEAIDSGALLEQTLSELKD